MDSELLDELLAKPIGKAVPPRTEPADADFTRQIELRGNTLTATIRDKEGEVNEGTALDYIEEEGQDPQEWVVTGFRKSKWGTLDNPMESVAFTFKRRADSPADEDRPDLDAMFSEIETHTPVSVRPDGSHGFLVLIGDMQFGKIDGDGIQGTLRRTIDCLNQAADLLVTYRERFDIGHVHIGWLGDHIEGFVSQSGANVWRTQLTLNEQIRLTRRVMMHALTTFAPLASRVSMAAVPGNHGEAVRFEGKGLTRYDDSHDTESLIAVHDAAQLNPEAYGHVEFYVPETDELTVLVNVAGTNIAHAHGHQYRPDKHFDWWKGQAFSKSSAMYHADVLVAGHLHHEHTDTDGDRLFIGVPAMESESTWFRHNTGTPGAPGLIVGVTKDAHVNVREVVRA